MVHGPRDGPRRRDDGNVSGDGRGDPDESVRSITFAALIMSILALILVNRSWRLPMWQTFRERRNTTLKWIVAATAVLLVVLLAVPGLRTAFNFGPIGPGDWAVALAAGFIGVAWFEAYKWWHHR